MLPYALDRAIMLPIEPSRMNSADIARESYCETAPQLDIRRSGSLQEESSGSVVSNSICSILVPNVCNEL